MSGILNSRVANLWPELPAHNLYQTVANGTECKNLINLWWLQLLKRQKLTFLPNHRFGTERSEVRILSPRPIISFHQNVKGESPSDRPYLVERMENLITVFKPLLS